MSNYPANDPNAMMQQLQQEAETLRLLQDKFRSQIHKLQVLLFIY